MTSTTPRIRHWTGFEVKRFRLSCWYLSIFTNLTQNVSSCVVFSFLEEIQQIWLNQTKKTQVRCVHLNHKATHETAGFKLSLTSSFLSFFFGLTLWQKKESERKKESEGSSVCVHKSQTPGHVPFSQHQLQKILLDLLTPRQQVGMKTTTIKTTTGNTQATVLPCHNATLQPPRAENTKPDGSSYLWRRLQLQPFHYSLQNALSASHVTCHKAANNVNGGNTEPASRSGPHIVTSTDTHTHTHTLTCLLPGACLAGTSSVFSSLSQSSVT